MDYVPHSDETIKNMKNILGISSLFDLFSTIPKNLLFDNNSACSILSTCDLDTTGMDELQLTRHVTALAGRNKKYKSMFRGAGSYHHFIPSAVDFLSGRSEFWTAYTPYQAEFNQGYLQAIFEYQSMMASLMGMKYSNASLYDGATSMVDAMVMALAHVRKRTKILVAGRVHPEYLAVARTSLSPRDMEIKFVSIDDMVGEIDDNTAAVVLQNPDFFGTIHDMKVLSAKIKERDKNVIVIQVVTEALSLALLASPSRCGVDIVVGEAQSFGIPMAFGGPALGFIGVNDRKLLHRLPGRIVGLASEVDGDDYGVTLTLQAREQHIRRERALSNICSNEALNMLRAVIYLSSLGTTGLSNLAGNNVKLANYLKSELVKLNGFTLVNKGPTFNEFVMKSERIPAESILDRCEEKNILGPLNLKHFEPEWKGMMLFCVTEMNAKADIDELIEIFREEAR